VLSRPLVRRLVLLPAVFAVTFAGAFAANPVWARSVGLDVWNASALAREHQEAIEQQRELNVVAAAIYQRIEAKEAIVRELVAGRMTLADATARFKALNAMDQDALRVIRETFPGSSDEEKTARNVIEYTLGRADAPAARARLDRRLKAEFQALFTAPPPAAD
jgi:hypothetical protein